MKNMDNEKMTELMISVCKSLTDEQKEKVKTSKKVKEMAECLGEMGVPLPNELMDSVTGGHDPSAQSVVLIDAIATAEAECKNCHKIFEYEYPWIGGMHDGPWNHPVPDYCPNCDPNVPRDR